VFVAAWPQTQRRWEVGSGESPFWRSDSKEIFFHAIDGWIEAISVKATAESCGWGPASRLFQLYSTPATLDGERFLVPRDLGEGKSDPVDLIMNWQELTRQRR
jgi:hypothetical protein